LATLSRDNWDVGYYWSPASGLQLGACDYRSIRVLWGASVPFVYVDYADAAWGPFTDVLRSTTAEIEVRDIVRGFDLRVTYDLYGPDYRYDHVWRFHDDGQFGSTIVVHGPGEEIYGRHVYHVPFRFDLDVSGASGDSVQRWVPIGRAGYWIDVLVEGGEPAGADPCADWDWQVIDRATNRRARIRAGESDNGELWALQYSPVESWSSWGGAQASPPGAPGSVPAVYAGGHSVQDTDVVLWYIARRSSRDLVATCGPWFGLAGYEGPDEDGHPHPEPDHPHDDEHPHDDDHPHA
jgi:hypothetical protein